MADGSVQRTTGRCVLVVGGRLLRYSRAPSSTYSYRGLMEPPQPRRVLVAGDVHGNRRWMGTLCKLARRHGCEIILQVGDFGYWPHTDDGRRFLAHVDWHAERNGIECVYWIDGNHENHDALSAVAAGGNGPLQISQRCIYLPRGVRWTWGGVRFGALGGAFSVDWRERVVGESLVGRGVPDPCRSRATRSRSARCARRARSAGRHSLARPPSTACRRDPCQRG